MNTLIAYYSFTRNNEKLAVYLQRRLNCEIMKVQTSRSNNILTVLLDMVFNRVPKLIPASFSLTMYDHVIFIAPIWGGKIAMPMKSFMMAEAVGIRHYSFLTVCGWRPGQKEKLQHELRALLGKPPVEIIELQITELKAYRKMVSKDGNGIDVEDFGIFNNHLRNFIKEENMVNSI